MDRGSLLQDFVLNIQIKMGSTVQEQQTAAIWLKKSVETKLYISFLVLLKSQNVPCDSFSKYMAAMFIRRLLKYLKKCDSEESNYLKSKILKKCESFQKLFVV
ncbi:hypothetical protein RF11_16261 [Thelohanellus kitauei]|uniref:Uncharacterized protein n=1 Tax=Thelohanellus kitauei TaxID=669202 RepID=A0A0C2JJL4_THEKT|nr:hypothetical protein RF11_16261 [Thelohanellus kitauei]